MDAKQKPKADPFRFNPGDNCWRVERADKLSFIIDGADYFRHLRSVMAQARHQLLLIGWDFDFEIEMCPGESDENGLAPDGMPNYLGAFIEALVENAPELQIYLLKWNGALLVAPGRIMPAMTLAVFGSDRIHFALDGHHPFGACHHQKIVVADDQFAFCGGIDATENRWDTSEHLSLDPRRVRKDGSAAPPWHDVTSATLGPVAAALGELSRARWDRATGDTLDVPKKSEKSLWPADLEVETTDAQVAIARTMPPYDGAPLVDEIEQMFLQSIRSARDTIYIESQYFAAEGICEALEDRLKEKDGPQIVVINPEAALSQFEDASMHALRARIIERLDEADHENRFRIFFPVTAKGDPIYVHAKVMVVDDDLLHLGSSNINNRSMGFDTECDVAINAPSDVVTLFRDRLLAEHLGVEVDAFAQLHADKGSLIAAIDTLNGQRGRQLRPMTERPETVVSGALADTRLMDPRFKRGEPTATGRGVRPRHLAVMAGVAILGYIGWRMFRK